MEDISAYVCISLMVRLAWGFPFTVGMEMSTQCRRDVIEAGRVEGAADDYVTNHGVRTRALR
jgi:hypothetical protein